MPLSAHLLLAATVLCCFATILVLPVEGQLGNHCLCLRTTSNQMDMRYFKSVEILPPGGSCGKTEIIVTRKDQKKVCLNPGASWVRSLVSQLLNRKSKKDFKDLAPNTAQHPSSS